MSKNIIKNWPFVRRIEDDEVAFFMEDFKNLQEESIAHNNGIVAITDGWQEGEVAAVLRGGVNARAVLDVLAASGVKHIKIFHLEESLPQLEEVFLSSVVGPANALFDSVSVKWRRDASVRELVKAVGKEYSMLFFGAPLAFSEIQPFYQMVKDHYSGSVTVVRGPHDEVEFDESDEIYRWVRQRTFDAGDFSLPAVLRSFKKKLNKKVAVLLPSLNEERTVGNVIKTALEVKAAGLIDEIILVDSSSSDSTVEIAKSYGIPVFVHQEIFPEIGSYRGKGEAMFKSAFVTDADILAWVDTDIESITPRFFYGLLGPMFTNPTIRFSKGYFSRPVKVEASGVELGGGRVTEILARPWINAFRPQLSGYIQPLAGTVAIYRDEFLKMRIPVNYGVEMAMLLQAVERAGLWATCQVNLGTVVHRSKDVIGLSEMAFQILQVLAEMGQGSVGAKGNETLRRVYSAHRQFEIGSKRFEVIWREYQ
ncbi:glucosyl-3-phosphoglycerate synthase [Sporomusa malonica]|uniref:Glucosyl-3-phosphoglycerate synthase n=1 Tax=Sporomusa malonica TaxID=112901 RepID=A0A1W2EDH7_9FIRM|nr:glucosyl-3-phosphoglycerate synthase [Sporomusa malonica]SMD07810.1 Glycosyl transferase family 2 [Sporomusa malonica]